MNLRKAISIVKEIEDYIVPLGKEEFYQLERSILSEGCREPLIVWPRSHERLILVDGHNRFKICKKYDIPFKVEKKFFKDIEDVKIWMVDNQIGRRNLTADQMSYYRGLKYLAMKKKKGGFDSVKLKGQSEKSTSEFLSKIFRVSESTVKRDAKFAEGLDIIGRSNLKLKMKILAGESNVRKTDVQILASSKTPDTLTIKNESDLYNKAKTINEEVLSVIENRLKIEKSKIKGNSLENAPPDEPLFADQSYRVQKIKGKIISEINHAVTHRNVNAIKELKKLIDRLAIELFSADEFERTR